MHQSAPGTPPVERRAPASVLVVDREPLAAMRLVSELEGAFGDRCWAWSEGSVDGALHLLRICRFRLVVLDATTADPPLEAAVRLLRQAAPDTPVLLHAWHRDAASITDAALAGTAGVAWKSDAAGLIRLVRGVLVHRAKG